MAMSKTYHLVESTDQATHYYIVPQHQTLIPKCSHSQRTLITLLSDKHDIHSATMITEYPICTRKQASMFGWLALTVKVHYVRHETPQEVARQAVITARKKFQQFLDDCGIDIDTL